MSLAHEETRLKFVYYSQLSIPISLSIRHVYEFKLLHQSQFEDNLRRQFEKRYGSFTSANTK